MLEGPLVFVDIDTQRDFLEESGALYVPGSRSILGNLERLSRYCRRAGVSRCWRPPAATLPTIPS